MRVVPGSKFVSFTGGELTLATNWATGLGALTHLTGPTDQTFNIAAGGSENLHVTMAGGVFRFLDSSGNFALKYSPSGTFADMAMDTSVASDDKAFRMGGGGDVVATRGGILQLYGLDHALAGNVVVGCGTDGQVQLIGDGSSSSILGEVNSKTCLYLVDTGLPTLGVGTDDPGGTGVTGLTGSLSPIGHFHGPSSVGSIIISGPGGQQLSFIDSDGAADVKWVRAGALDQVLNFESLTDAGAAKHTMLSIDGDNGRVGVLKSSPDTELDVAGVTTGTNDGKVYDTVPSTGDASLGIYTKVVDHTTNGGGATETVANFFPAGAVPLGVSALVTTLLAGAGLTTWDIGDSVDDNLWGDSLALAAGTSTDATDWTAAPSTHAWSAVDSDLILTANAGQFDSGVVRLTLFYTLPTAPTT